MSDPGVVDQARSAVTAVLDALRVSRVVCVDDTYKDKPPDEEIVAAAASLDEKTLATAFPELAAPPGDDPDVLAERIRQALGGLGEADRAKRAEAILSAARLKDGVDDDDPGDASILGELIPKDRLVTLSPQQWEKRRDDLLKEDAERRTLFLFDRDFSDDGGDKEGGIKIIASLLARGDTGNLICGLLTHTVTPENQPREWADLSLAHNIPRDRFIVIPKLYLSQDPVLFAQILKYVALSPDFTELKKKTKKIIEDAASAAASKVEEISILDLDHIVFQVSAKEGMWEPDMLFRLHALFHRLESRRLAHEGGELEGIARRLRAVSQIPTRAEHSPMSSTWAIQREELYESGDYLNRNHLPIELGDIFIKTGTTSQKSYILLAQPCDLMVRNDGERHPRLDYVPLAEIAMADVPPQDGQVMSCFGNSAGEHWYVRLKRVQQVPAWLLDLCVFNTDGVATIIAGTGAPDGIRPAWRKRYEILSKLMGRLARRLDLLAPITGEPEATAKVKAAIREALAGDLLDRCLFKEEAVTRDGNHGISYNCRRTGRLSRAQAFGLLMAYTGYLARPAFDREFVCETVAAKAAPVKLDEVV